MPAFLSHSSRDKPFVEEVAAQLPPGSYELDSQTFDLGLFSSEAAIASIKRSKIFCLFLSTASLSSDFVDFEITVSQELMARGSIGSFLTICIDDESFERARQIIRLQNSARKCVDPSAAARLIISHSIGHAEDLLMHSFFGREEEIKALSKRRMNAGKPHLKGLFLSGNSGSGRRSLAREFYRRNFPSVNSISPTLHVDTFSGLTEFYRKLISTLRPFMRVSELRVRIQTFEASSLDDRVGMIRDLLYSSQDSRDFLTVFDSGGLLNDSGSLNPDISLVLDKLKVGPYPPVVFISNRMPPPALRRAADDIHYQALRALPREDSELIIGDLLQKSSIPAGEDQIQKVITLCDGHPAYMHKIVEFIVNDGIDSVVQNTIEFDNWKTSSAYAYVTSISFSKNDTLVISLLNIIPELDYDSFIGSLLLTSEDVAASLSHLVSIHILETFNGRYWIAPALRVALERDRRMRLDKATETRAVSAAATSLSVRIDDGAAPIALIDSAVLASLQSGIGLTSVASAFILPSHLVVLAKRNYDRRNYQECIRLSKEALAGSARLSSEGKIAAARFLCLAASRLNDEPTFQFGINELKKGPIDKWGGSNISYLLGFNARLKGHLPTAEVHFRESYRLSPGNSSATRDLAAVCLARENLVDAEKYARECFARAPENVYFVDILLSTLIKKYGINSQASGEINDLFTTLRRVGESNTMSFYTTRRAEYELLHGKAEDGLTLIRQAANKTPHLFEVLRIKAELLMKTNQYREAKDVIEQIRRNISGNDDGDRGSHRRTYLALHGEYLIQSKNYTEAKKVLGDKNVFSDVELAANLKKVETAQSYDRR